MLDIVCEAEHGLELNEKTLCTNIIITGTLYKIADQLISAFVLFKWSVVFPYNILNLKLCPHMTLSLLTETFNHTKFKHLGIVGSTLVRNLVFWRQIVIVVSPFLHFFMMLHVRGDQGNLLDSNREVESPLMLGCARHINSPL